MALDQQALEAAARAACKQGGFDPDEVMPNDGPRWRYYLPGAEATVTAYLASLGDGRLVPVEPTPEMLKAGMDDLGWWVEPYEAPRESGVPVDSDMTAEDADRINAMQIEVVASAFRSMLAAAPTPPGEKK